MKIEQTPITDLLIIKPDVYHDERGYFMETYNENRYRQFGIEAHFLQDNLSCSHYGVVRGLHFQRPPYAQAKLVSCPVGKVWDVAVDLRKKSKTFMQWFGVELSEDNHFQFFIPRGFAHGFVALSEKSVFTYKCDSLYNAESESGINAFDANLNIQWPVEKTAMRLNEKDLNRPPLHLINNPF